MSEPKLDKDGNPIVEDGDNDNNDDDFFEGILNNDDDPNTDPNDDPDKSKLDQETDAEKLAKVLKENKGLKKATVKYRQDRAETKGRLDSLEKVIQEGLKTRSANADDNKVDDKDKDKNPLDELKELEAHVNDDGNVVVPVDKLTEILRNQDKKLDDVTEAQKLENNKRDAKIAYENHVSELVGQKEGYNKAYDTLKLAAKGIEGGLKEVLVSKKLNADQKVTPGQALDLLQGTDQLKKFKEDFPMVDPDILVRAFDSDYDFTRALDQVIDRNFGIKEDDKGDIKPNKDSDSAFDAIKSKPNSLQGQSNQAASVGSVVDRASKFNTEDILSLNDADAERLEKAMAKEARESDL